MSGTVHVTEEDFHEIEGALFTLDWIATLMARGELVESQQGEDPQWPAELVLEVQNCARALRKQLGVEQPEVDTIIGEIESATRETIFNLVRRTR